MLWSSTFTLAGVVMVFDNGAAYFGVFKVSSFFESFCSILLDEVDVFFLRSGLVAVSRRAGAGFAGDTEVEPVREKVFPFLAPFFAAAFFLASFSAFFFLTLRCTRQ